jgi:hypothetical protein
MDGHQYGEMKRTFIEAHANHVAFKQKRTTSNVDADNDNQTGEMA